MKVPHGALPALEGNFWTESRRTAMRTLYDLQALRYAHCGIAESLRVLKTGPAPDPVRLAQVEAELRSKQDDIAAYEAQLAVLRQSW